MEAINIVRDDNTQVYNKILFERPISRVHARKIGLLAGKHASLKKVSDAYQIIGALNHDLTIVAEEELKEHNVPAEVYLYGSKKASNPYVNSDEALYSLENCNYVVAGMDIEINSRLQIFLEKFIKSRNAPIIFSTDSIALFKLSPKLLVVRTGDLFICNTKSLIELAEYTNAPVSFKENNGILNKLNLLQSLAQQLQAHIICIENYQVLSSSYTDSGRAGVVNIKNPQDISIDYLYIPILTSLLCDVPNPEIDLLDRILTAGYLLRTSLASENDFIQKLKNVIKQD
ncbi:hypothetical protein H0W80_00560 [Candidatus Saccharibacteria bacterium]|nr:hypothetical protein [Candidatus Saccharibacteria bacterium]